MTTLPARNPWAPSGVILNNSKNGQADLVPAAWDQAQNWFEMAPVNMQALVWQAQCQ